MTARKVAKKSTKPSATNVVKKSANAAGKTSPPVVFPKGVSQPATRALASIGVTQVDQLTRHREADVAALHGMGPKALGILKTELESRGKSFKA